MAAIAGSGANVHEPLKVFAEVTGLSGRANVLCISG